MTQEEWDDRAAKAIEKVRYTNGMSAAGSPTLVATVAAALRAERERALEEAAKVCDDVADSGMAYQPDELARKIRRLKETP